MLGARRVVITGGQGRLARVLAPALADAGWQVHALGVRDLDVSSREAVQEALGAIRPDAVVNLAAMTNIDTCERQPAAAHAVNVVGVSYLSEACEYVGAHLLHLSSDYVFDGRRRVPYVETDVAEPLSVYGSTKLKGEAAAGDRATVVRTAWVSSEFAPSLVHTVLNQASSRHELRFIADQTGSPTSAVDLSAMLIRLLSERLPGLFHVTNGGTASWYDLARYVLELAGHDPDRVVPVTTDEYEPAPMALRPRYSVLDNAAVRDAGLPGMADWRTAFAGLVRPAALSGHV